jgi:hypothetical protein
MNVRLIFLCVFVEIVAGFTSFAQSGESVFKKVTVNSQQKQITDIFPSFSINYLDFADENNRPALESSATGELKLCIMNEGLNTISALGISIKELNSTKGLEFEPATVVNNLNPGDSALVHITVTSNDSLKDGTAIFEVMVNDLNGYISKSSQITFPLKGSVKTPLFEWIIPTSLLEQTDFPAFEISGVMKSETRIKKLTLYVNGMVPEDGHVFKIIPAENPDESFIKRTLILNEGYNEIRIEAENGAGVSLSEKRVVNYSVQKIDQAYREKRIALVIGNADYVSGNSLLNPLNDAQAIAAALKELNFNVFTYLNADQKSLKKAMDEFGEHLPEYNVGLFYFAGHGLQVNGINYLIPVDATITVAQDVEYDCVDVGRLLGKMEAAGTATNIVILDACRDNPFERSWSGRSTGRGNGLAFMTAPSGSIIAYATSPGKTASDGTGKNGLYTEALLEYINVPGLPIEEFFKNVRRTVELRSNKAQTPWESTSLKGNFYFRLK